MIEQQQANQTLGEWAYIAIANQYNRYNQYEKEVLKDKDPEHLHKMRVGMRRLRSIIACFALAVDLPTNVTPTSIGKVAKILGKLRDIDVLQETLVTQYQPHIPKSEQKSLEIVFKKLKKQRKSAFKAVSKTLKGKSYSKLQNNFQLWLDNPKYQSIAALDVKQILPDLLLPQISYLLLHPGWLIGLDITDGAIAFFDIKKITMENDISLTQEKILHDLRKVAKQTRYNMELFQELYCPTYSNYLEEIKEIQIVLGMIQDYFILEQFLQQILKQKIAQTMPTLNEILREKRQQQWQKWQTKQEDFLNIFKRQDLRTVVQYPLNGMYF
ncbi:conserved hypothetical protein [Hyella patelloides LEGE 07179]|uniref:CHAD domain-containing protein n=1 Tax=Hyella patelloides LEGE 07179 TaxID=945734 RepID=A0A563VLZ0_9CYAN|nr:CHAD domain-containing protein [Hyella patelloides]VEP12470.1 conserved hypothetical protein [Hyella patelloides LEGE 07179]